MVVAAVLPFGRSVPYLVGSRLRSLLLLPRFLSRGQIARFDCLLRPRNGHWMYVVYRAGEPHFGECSSVKVLAMTASYSSSLNVQPCSGGQGTRAWLKGSNMSQGPEASFSRAKVSALREKGHPCSVEKENTIA